MYSKTCTLRLGNNDSSWLIFKTPLLWPLRHNVVGAVFGFGVDFREIFAQNTQTEKLDASDENHYAGLRRPAIDWVSKEDAPYNKKNQSKHANNWRTDANPSWNF